MAETLPTPPEPIHRKSLLYRSGLGFHCINHVLGPAALLRFRVNSAWPVAGGGRTDWLVTLVRGR